MRNLICTSENDYTEPVTYEYNAENRLSVVKQGGTVLMAALYDGDQNGYSRSTTPITGKNATETKW